MFNFTKSQDAMKLFSWFLIVAVAFKAETVQCEEDYIDMNAGEDGEEADVPCNTQIADRCFGDVQDDLRLIFDAPNNVQAANMTVLRDLCSAWEDSLKCTSDIIDDGCNVVDGRLKFDHWNSALRETFQYVCSGDLRALRDVFHSVRCFNMSGFLYCMQKTAKINHVADLLTTELDVIECGMLHKIMQRCAEYVEGGTCAREVLEPVRNIFEAFFNSSECTRGAQTAPATSSLSASIARPSVIAVDSLLSIMSLFLTIATLQRLS